MKSLETLHVHTDHKPEEHRSSFNVTIVIVYIFPDLYVSLKKIFVI